MNNLYEQTHRPSLSQGAHANTPGEQSPLTQMTYDGITHKGHAVKLLPDNPTEAELLDNTMCSVCYKVYLSSYKSDCGDDHPLCTKCFIGVRNHNSELSCPLCSQEFRTVEPVTRVFKNIVSKTSAQCPDCNHKDRFENMDGHIGAQHPERAGDPPPDIQAARPLVATQRDRTAESGRERHISIDDFPDRPRTETIQTDRGASYYAPPQSGTISTGRGFTRVTGGQESTVVTRDSRSVRATRDSRSVRVTGGSGSIIAAGGSGSTIAARGSGSIIPTESHVIHSDVVQAAVARVDKTFEAANVCEISLSTISGHIRVLHGISRNYIRIRSSADCNLELEGGKISCRTDSSSITLNLPQGRGGELHLKSHSGSIFGTVSTPGSIHSCSGKMRIIMYDKNIRVSVDGSITGPIRKPWRWPWRSVPTPRTLTVSSCRFNLRVDVDDYDIRIKTGSESGFESS